MNKAVTFMGRLVVAVAALVLAGVAQAEDIDIYIGNDTTNSSLPSALIVLDNTSNWARQSQQWPGGLAQGQSEVRAIKNALAGQVGKINVGLMEYTTGGNANQNGAFVRFALQELTSESYAELSVALDKIFTDINEPEEKRSANTPYGNLMRDVYSYLAGGGQSFSGGGTESSLADPDGYSTAYSVFKSPLVAENVCNDVNLIFISNPNQSGPADDDVSNSNFLAQLYAEADGTLSNKLSGFSSGSPLAIPLLSTTTENEVTDIGFSSQCYKNNEASLCTTNESQPGKLCDGVSSCSCSSSQSTTAGCSGGKKKFIVQSTTSSTVVEETGEYDNVSGSAWNFDDWAKFLHEYGVPVVYESESGETLTTRVNLNIHTLDVFNAQQDAEHSGLMISGSERVGGGNYYAATNEEQLELGLNDALSNILSVSSTFAAVALPLNTTNRAQNENQVFIGMFRPDQQAKPRWFGNLKEYQLGFVNNAIELVDVKGNSAVSPLTGFAAECAESFWSSDSGTYWEGLGITPSPMGQCLTSQNSPWSDLPDGPFVEKGGVAQVLRNSVLDDRTLKSVSDADALVTFDSGFATAKGLGSLYEYIRGDAVGQDETAGDSNGRPSIHGDVIHSRPLPVNYGTEDQTVIYYGANDGLLRAVQVITDQVTGEQQANELWGLIAPEHFGKLNRLYENSPKVAFPNQVVADDETTPEPKDYFFDGSIGQLVRYDSDNQVEQAWIYPVMRRGGRMVYALDVTDPNDPQLLWRKGCPFLASDSECDSGYEDIGQTWSTPKAIYVADAEYADTPLLVFGGGYDACEDDDTVSSSCTADDKGNAVFLVNAETGAIVKTFATERSVAADVSPVDVDFDGKTDYVYAADTGGNIWRINFVESSGDVFEPLSDAEWGIAKAAFTDGGSRKFMSAPAVLPYQGKVYLALGSGNRERPLESNYPYVNDIDDRFYVYLDYPAVSTAVDLDGSDMNDSTTEPNCDANRVFPGLENEKRGWYMSLSGRGEQVVNPAVIAGGNVLFNSYKPGGAQLNACVRPLGLGTAYNMSLFNGSSCGRVRSEQIDNGGMPIPPGLSTVSVVKPNCTGEGCEETITICIGCKGLEPTEIEPDVDSTRRRVYWKSDIDR